MDVNNPVTKNLVSFFSIAFGLTWLLQAPALLDGLEWAQIPVALIRVSILAPFGPMIAAFWLTWRSGRRTGIKAFWKRGWDFSFDKKWLAITLLLPAVSAGLTILGMQLIGKPISWDQQPLPPAFALPVFLVIFLTQALPEEYGWRGYALDGLQNRWSALTSSLILGFLWGAWHLPLHFIAGTTQAVIPIPEFILKQMLGAIFYTWIYNNTNRNIFLAILLHAVWNLFGGLVPFWVTSEGRWVNFGIEFVLAVGIVLVYGPKFLSAKKSIRKNTASS